MFRPMKVHQSQVKNTSIMVWCPNIYIYKVFQEKRSVFWKVTVSVILSKKLYINMCPIPNGFRDRAI